MNITLDPKQFRIEKTTRGAPCLIFENYKFRYGNKMKDEIRWRCTNKTCKATIKTNEKGITEKRTVHDHEPFVDRRAKKKNPLKQEDRSMVKPSAYVIPAASHFVECRQSNDTFHQTNVDLLPSVVRTEPNLGGVRYVRKDGTEVIVVNEAPTHFMDLLSPTCTNLSVGSPPATGSYRERFRRYVRIEMLLPPATLTDEASIDNDADSKKNI